MPRAFTWLAYWRHGVTRDCKWSTMTSQVASLIRRSSRKQHGTENNRSWLSTCSQVIRPWHLKVQHSKPRHTFKKLDVLFLHQHEEVCDLWYLKTFRLSFWNIAVKDKHVLVIVWKTPIIHYSKIFILWQRYLHCVFCKQFEVNFLLLFGKSNMKKIGFSSELN